MSGGYQEMPVYTPSEPTDPAHGAFPASHGSTQHAVGFNTPAQQHKDYIYLCRVAVREMRVLSRSSDLYGTLRRTCDRVQVVDGRDDAGMRTCHIQMRCIRSHHHSLSSGLLETSSSNVMGTLAKGGGGGSLGSGGLS